MDETCPFPTPPSSDETNEIAAMLNMKRIAIVGLSDDPSRPSFQVASYLLAHGKEVIPVNPTTVMVMGLKAYARLADIPGEIELVNVFRRSEFCAEVTKDAIARGAKGVWLQAGIHNDEARALARKAGIHYVEGRCIMVEHMHHS